MRQLIFPPGSLHPSQELTGELEQWTHWLERGLQAARVGTDGGREGATEDMGLRWKAGG